MQIHDVETKLFLAKFLARLAAHNLVRDTQVLLPTPDYERRTVRDSPQPLFRQASAVLPEDARVLSLDEPRMYGLWRPFVAATVFDRPALTLFLRAGETPEGVAPAEVARRIRAAGFTHVLTNPAFTRYQLEVVGSPWRSDAVEALAAAIVTGHARLVLQDGSARLYELP